MAVRQNSTEKASKPKAHIWITDEEVSTKRKCGLQFPSIYKLGQHCRLAEHFKQQHSSQPGSVFANRQKIKKEEKGESDGKSKEEVKRCEVCTLTDEDEIEGDRG